MTYIITCPFCDYVGDEKDFKLQDEACDCPLCGKLFFLDLDTNAEIDEIDEDDD